MYLHVWLQGFPRCCISRFCIETTDVAPTWAEQLGQWQSAGRISASLSLVQWSSTLNQSTPWKKSFRSENKNMFSLCVFFVCYVVANCRELFSIAWATETNRGHLWETASGVSRRDITGWRAHRAYQAHRAHLNPSSTTLCCANSLMLGLARTGSEFSTGKVYDDIYIWKCRLFFQHWDGDGASVWRLTMFDHVV